MPFAYYAAASLADPFGEVERPPNEVGQGPRAKQTVAGTPSQLAIMDNNAVASRSASHSQNGPASFRLYESQRNSLKYYRLAKSECARVAAADRTSSTRTWWF